MIKRATFETRTRDLRFTNPNASDKGSNASDGVGPAGGITPERYPPVTCCKHPTSCGVVLGVFLVDVVGADGSLTQACPACAPLELVDVVRQLFVAKGAA